MLLAIVLLAPIAYFEEAKRNAGNRPSSYAHSSESDEGDSAQSTFADGWRIGDTYPQWIMAIFTVTAAGISFWAIGLLRDTLSETRRTANAALDANNTAREIGEAQVRAYVGIISGSVMLVHGKPNMTDQRLRPVLTINVKNYGRSPALRFQWAVSARYYPPLHSEFLGSLDFAPESWGRDIGVDEQKPFTTNLGSAPLDEGHMRTLAAQEFHMDFVVRYRFRDVFKNLIEDERVFTAYVPVNGIDIEAPLIPHVFDRETIGRMAEASSPENLARMADALRGRDADSEARK